MMMGVADASPLNILVRIGHVEVLPRFFGMVAIPSAVAEVLSHPATPAVVRNWLASKPAWLAVRSTTGPDTASLLRHRGEREAIKLAQELKADLPLVDELRAR